MATKKEEALFVRNGRPNGVVFHYDNVRYKLEHRGSRQDSTSLPIEALNDNTISRWLKQGQLEKISRESFMKLGARQVDILPNEFLKQSRIRNTQKGELAMHPADSDTTRSLTQITDKDVHKAADPSSKWAGDLMTTDEELETFDYNSDHLNYPSKNRDDDQRRQMGY